MTTKQILLKEARTLRSRLNKVKGSYMSFAEGSGLSYKWVCDFRDKKVANPTYDSLIKLDIALRRKA